MNPLFEKIITTCSVPGNETNLRDMLISEFTQFGAIHKTRWTGFYCDYKKNLSNKKRKRIVITAHMDAPGFIVQDIEENGLIKAISLGGLRPTLMDLRQVLLQTSKKTFRGILRLQAPVERTTEAVYKCFFGFSSQKAALKAGVQKGDSICFDAPIVQMENNLIAAPHLDNRIGIYLMLEIAKKLEKEKLNCNVYFAATSCEEIGGRGAKILANMIEPDIAICLDTTYEEGSVKMGKGPVATLSDAAVALPTKIRDTLTKIAKTHKNPLQYEVYNYAGTDAKDFRDIGKGCLTLPILIATLNNHSPHEICSLKDIEHTRKFVLTILKNHKLLEV